jgi:hypothetical protein
MRSLAPGDCEFIGERLAVNKGAKSLGCCLLAVAGRAVSVSGGQRSLFCGVRAFQGGTLALPGGADDDLGAGDRARAVIACANTVALCHGEIARVGGDVGCPRGKIAGVRDGVALGGGGQSRLRVLIAIRSAGLAHDVRRAVARLIGNVLHPADSVRLRQVPRPRPWMSGQLVTAPGSALCECNRSTRPVAAPPIA